MNILVVLGGIGVEGISNIALSYLEEFEKSDAQFSLAIGGPSEKMMLERARKIGIPIYELPYRKKNPAHFYPALIKLICKHHFDIIHVHGNSATMALDMFSAMLAGCKIRLPHTHNTACDSGRVSSMLKPILNALMTEGFACGQLAGEWLYGKNGSFKVINNGRKVERYLYCEKDRAIYRKKLGLIDGQKAIGHVGTFTDQKNQEFLIRSFSRINDEMYHLFLFGDGPLRQNNEELVKELQLEKRVLFCGNVSDINGYLNAMDVMALPSRYEGLPLVSIEWQINGLPCVISSNVTKDCKIMKNVIFMDVQEDNHNEWAECIVELSKNPRKIITDEEVYERVTRAGFNITENAAELKREYQHLLEMKGII